VGEGVAAGVVEARGMGASQMGEGLTWTVRRGAVMCGFSLPERQTADLLAAIVLLRDLSVVSEVALYGKGALAAHAIYAAVLDDTVTELVLEDPPATHLDPDTPEFPGVLRVGDLPQNLALVFPRPITFIGEMPAAYRWTADVYEKLGMADRIRVIETVSDWQPLA
jgi:hypothetical protein